MNNRVVAVALLIAGLMTWLAPSYQGVWSGPADVSDGEGLIASAIFIAGAAIV